jgi:hypothetical protein
MTCQLLCQVLSQRGKFVRNYLVIYICTVKSTAELLFFRLLDLVSHLKLAQLIFVLSSYIGTVGALFLKPSDFLLKHALSEFFKALVQSNRHDLNHAV